MRILGMEFGAWSLKAVEMESRFKKVEILDLHEVRLPLENLDPTAAYKKAVQDLMARLPSHPEKIVASLPPAQTALRFLNLPIKQRKKVETSFKFELEDSVPFKLDDSIIEHYVSRTKEGSLVFAAIAPKRYVQSHIDWLMSVGVDPDWLTFEGMGIINLYLSSPPPISILSPEEDEDTGGPVLLMDIGHLKTNIAILENDQLKLFRSIAWGGWAITQAISGALGISAEEAEQRKMNDLKLYERTDDGAATAKGSAELTEAATQALNSFVAEISHSLVSFRAQYKTEISSIQITGGTSRTKGIEEYLSRALDKPVDFFKPFHQLKLGKEVDLSQEMRFGEPLGRAYVYTRKSALMFNFRKAEMAKGTSLTEVGTFIKNPGILRLLRYAGFFSLVLFLYVVLATPLSQEESHKSNQELSKVFQDNFRTVPAKLRTSLTTNPQELKKFLDQKNNEMEQKLKMLSKRRIPMMGIIKSISDAFPPTVKVDVNTLSLDDRAFTVEGVLYEGNLDAVSENMKKVAALSSVSVKKDGQRFTITGQVNGR
jgi:type IV pilus assembly protein PilM